ncbi:MAG: elongation factor G [Candidatus Izemoplasmataceae bacterium]
MKQYDIKHIRTIAVMGHLGSGKTSLMESILHVTGAKEKKGSVEEKSTTSDYLTEEKEHQASLSTSLIPVEYHDYKFNFLDTPGNRELLSDVNQVLSVVKGAILVVDGTKGIDIGTEEVLLDLNERNIPTIIFINKMDKENIKFDELIQNIRDMIGYQATPFLWPIGVGDDFNGYYDLVDMTKRTLENGKVVDHPMNESEQEEVAELREAIIESVAETSEELLEKHFAGEKLTDDEIRQGLRQGVLVGDLKPILIGSATKDIGPRDMLEMIEKFMPAPDDLKPIEGTNPKNKEKVVRKTTNEEPFSAYVFKTMVDPFIGTMSYIKVFSGEIKPGQEVLIGNNGESVKINQISLFRGKEQLDIEKMHAGDIGVLIKLDALYTGATICDPKHPIVFEGPGFPSPTMYVAIHPKNKQDEDKISSSLNRLAIEDPSFDIKRNKETNQLLLGGQGMSHITYVLEKLKNMFKVDVDISDQKIVYRETIKRKAEAEGRHKKQSGGSGQFGVVKMIFEPMDPNQSDFEFEEQIHGGSVPKNYFPAVEKGLIETFQAGPLAGYPVIGVKATLIDGAYHDVDSNEISFKIAASLAFKNVLEKAQATLLEPIMQLAITIKDDYVGDVMGDINKRRGRVLGIEPLGGGKQRIDAEVPEVEIVRYTTDLKAMTQGTGQFTRKFVRYEEVPERLQQDIIAEANKEE